MSNKSSLHIKSLAFTGVVTEKIRLAGKLRLILPEHFAVCYAIYALLRVVSFFTVEGLHHLVSRKRLIGLLPFILIVLFSIPVTAAQNSLGPWRGQVALTRIQAENNATVAYKEARHLQEMLPRDATPIDQVRLLNLLARIEVHLAMTEPAAVHAQQALEMAKKFGDKVGHAEADLNIALSAINQNNIDAMAAAVTDSMVILEGVNRPDLISEAMLRTSMMYCRMEQFDDSVAMAVKSLTIAQQSNNPLALTYAYQGMAAIYDLGQHHKEAMAYYTKMREQAKAANSRLLESDALLGMGGTAIKLGDKHGSERFVQEAIANYRIAGGLFYLGRALFVQATNLGIERRFAQAVPILNEVVSIYQLGDNKIGQWWALNARSENYQLLGKTSLSVADAEHAYQLAKEIGFPLYLSDSARRMAAIAKRRGDLTLAYKLSVEAGEMSAKAVHEKVAARVIELATHYEAESRQSQIDELSRRNEWQASEIRRQTLHKQWLETLVIASYIIFILTVLFLVHLWCSYRQLQRSQRHQQAILDAIPDLMFELGLDGRYYDCHALHPDFLVELIGDILGKTVSDIMPKEAAEICLSALREAHEKGVSTGKEIELPLLQGAIWFELSIARKLVAQGDEPRFIMLSRDITERKLLEIKLYERERDFRTLAENSPNIIVRYDLDCRRTYLNRSYLDAISGSDKALSFTPMEFWALRLPTAEDYMRSLQNVMVTGEPLELLAEYLDKNGLMIYFTMSLVPEFDEHGQVMSVLSISHNITDIKATERLLQESQHLLRQLAARRETVREDERKFLAQEVHDELGQYLMALRMNMTAVSLDFGINNPALQDEMSELITLLDSTIQVVRNVVSSLRPKALDMGIVPALEWLVEEYRKHTAIKCSLHILNEVFCLDDIRATAVFRVVQESLTNIARHAKASEVEIVLEQKGIQYALEVRDNGTGFDATVLKDQSFGLLGMRERVIALGGEFEISSGLGRGTVIKVSIPVNYVWSKANDSNIDC